ncbi:MAG: type II toxin-antitoxin system mRNA interferase toxin, RelE/StbE family [Candidatus Levybacteria bacterium]|nr:type II toxin-antitoxin system mRNA interferase toxin, RelE/StbE family [Candidatus Levybacteria bacterium]
MIIVFRSAFLKALKKKDIRIRKSFKHRIELFEKNPNNPQLNNHALQREWEGYRSINITSDWRAIYEEVHEEGGTIVYFIPLGKHKELYQIN